MKMDPGSCSDPTHAHNGCNPPASTSFWGPGWSLDCTEDCVGLIMKAFTFTLIFILISQMVSVSRMLVRCYLRETLSLIAIIFFGLFILLSVDCRFTDEILIGSKISTATDCTVSLLLIGIGTYAALNTLNLVACHLYFSLVTIAVIFAVIAAFLFIDENFLETGLSPSRKDQAIFVEDPVALFKGKSEN